MLTLPESLLEKFPPRPPNMPRDQESFMGYAGPVFDPMAPVLAAADINVGRAAGTSPRDAADGVPCARCIASKPERGARDAAEDFLVRASPAGPGGRVADDDQRGSTGPSGDIVEQPRGLAAREGSGKRRS